MNPYFAHKESFGRRQAMAAGQTSSRPQSAEVTNRTNPTFTFTGDLNSGTDTVAARRRAERQAHPLPRAQAHPPPSGLCSSNWRLDGTTAIFRVRETKRKWRLLL